MSNCRSSYASTLFSGSTLKFLYVFLVMMLLGTTSQALPVVTPTAIVARGGTLDAYGVKLEATTLSKRALGGTLDSWAKTIPKRGGTIDPMSVGN
ncbi:hypothetical protein T439DRAFT_328026 [Meredithblackwellia eburnea MCA 4105]